MPGDSVYSHGDGFMTLVKVDNLVPGVVLSKDVFDSNSRLLLSKGRAIENKDIRLMKMWGIFDVDIDSVDTESAAPNASADSKQLRVVAEEIKRLFKCVDITHPAVKEIVRICIQYRLEHSIISNKVVDINYEKNLETLNSKDIMAKIDRIDIKLPEVPSLVFELNEIISNPMSSAGEIAQVINRSPSLAATLLKIVNSAFYGLRSKIDSIARAVMLMGSKEVSNLAMGITIMETFKDIPKDVMDVASFLEHNLACGIIARILAAHSNMAQTEQLFVSGMLHDIGRLVLYKYFPLYAKLTIMEAEQSAIALLKAEQKILGCSHAHLGKKLLNKWKLPLSLVDNVFYHHNPSSSPNPALAVTIQIADMIVHGLGFGNSAEQVIPSFDTKAWERVNLPLSAFNSIIKQAEHQVETFRDLMNKG